MNVFSLILGEKPYACKQCDKRFADSGALTNHQAREHSTGDENIYKCTVCCKVKFTKNPPDKLSG